MVLIIMTTLLVDMGEISVSLASTHQLPWFNLLMASLEQLVVATTASVVP